MRLKQGFVREDGMVFSQYYNKNGIEKEMWYSRDVFEKIKKRRIKRRIDWQKQNKEKHAKAVKEWRRKNPEKSKKSNTESSALWRKRNPEKSKIQSTMSYFKRRCIKNNQLHPDHDKEKEMELVKVAKFLNLQVDHIVPLSRGGWHWHCNLRLLPPSLNASKGNRLDCEVSERDQKELSMWTNLTGLLICSFSH
jgi:5-methylcytosine-specific restriction endonuclease McrA